MPSFYNIKKYIYYNYYYASTDFNKAHHLYHCNNLYNDNVWNGNSYLTDSSDDTNRENLRNRLLRYYPRKIYGNKQK